MPKFVRLHLWFELADFKTWTSRKHEVPDRSIKILFLMLLRLVTIHDRITAFIFSYAAAIFLISSRYF